jgi:hypothetical protein
MGLFDSIIGVLNGGGYNPPIPGVPSGIGTSGGSSGSTGSTSTQNQLPSWLQAVLGIGSVATPLILGAMGNSNSKNQANAALAAANQANQLAAAQYAQNRQDMLPWIQAGQGSVNQLAYMLGIPTGSNLNALLAPRQGVGGSSGPIRSYTPGGGSTPYIPERMPAPDVNDKGQLVPNFKLAPEYSADFQLPEAIDDSYKQHQQLAYAYQGNPMAGYDPNTRNYVAPRSGGIGTPEGGIRYNPALGISGNDQPSTGTGQNNGFGSLMHDFGAQDFEADPGYQFRLSEGQKALERSAAARGNALGGSAVKAAQRFGQDFASNEFTNAYNRFQSNRATKYNQLAGLAGLGQTSANTLTNQGISSAGQQGNNLIYGTNAANQARQSGYDSLAGGIANGTNNLLDLLRKMGHA